MCLRNSVLVYLTKAQFSRYPLTRYERVTSVDFSQCEAKATACAKMVCPTADQSRRNNVLGLTDQVCGNDGVTYANLCQLHRSTCTKGTQLAHQGACAADQLREAMTGKKAKKMSCSPQECSEDDEKEAFVCGSDGNIYK